MKIRVYADLHLYINNNDIDRYDTTELLDLKTRLYTDPVDVLIFAGDLTHKVYSTDDRRFVNTIRFIAGIHEACKATNTIFRIIKGTSTHEGKVIEALQKIYENDSILKCFTSVTYEDINGLVFRFLPEPYFDTYSNFYQYAFSENADITIFHGTIDGVIPFLKQTDNPTNLQKSVLIKADDLMSATRLFSVGGHIHKHINIRDRIFYTNSLTTHNFADVNDIKGFMEFEIDEDLKWKYRYIENTKAPKFVSVNIDNIHLKSKDDLTSILSNMLLTLTPKDHLRFVVSGDRDLKAMSNLEFLKQFTKKYNVKIDQKLDDIIEDDTATIEEANYFSDRSIPLTEKIQKLVEEQHGMLISKEDIEKYIT